jgi:hypothetical protein
MKNFWFQVLGILLLTISGCSKYDLDRDNPTDAKKSSSSAKTEYEVKFSRFKVASDNNNDQVVNKGEAIKLLLYLKNNGSSKVNKVKAIVSTNSPYVMGLSPTSQLSFDNGYTDYGIAPGSEAYAATGYASSSAYSIGFNVSSTTPSGTEITFNITITDELGNSWTDKFAVTVQATGAVVNFSRFKVAEDNNADQVVNKGESVKLLLYLKNNGSSKVNKVKATVSTNSPYVTGLSPTSQLSFDNGFSDYDISPGSEAYAATGYASSSAYSIGFNASNTTPSGTNITFNINITDESSNNWTDAFTITIQ